MTNREGKHFREKNKANNKNLYRFQTKMCDNNIYKTLFQMRFGEGKKGLSNLQFKHNLHPDIYIYI